VGVTELSGKPGSGKEIKGTFLSATEKQDSRRVRDNESAWGPNPTKKKGGGCEKTGIPHTVISQQTKWVGGEDGPPEEPSSSKHKKKNQANEN